VFQKCRVLHSLSKLCSSIYISSLQITRGAQLIEFCIWENRFTRSFIPALLNMTVDPGLCREVLVEGGRRKIAEFAAKFSW
jgi:hypothetical protein